VGPRKIYDGPSSGTCFPDFLTKWTIWRFDDDLLCTSCRNRWGEDSSGVTIFDGARVQPAKAGVGRLIVELVGLWLRNDIGCIIDGW